MSTPAAPDPHRAGWFRLPTVSFNGSGDTHFRDVGADRAPAQPRIGFRAFGVHVAAERKIIRRPGIGKPVLRGPLRLVEDEANGTLTGPFRTAYHYTPGINTATCDAPMLGQQGPRHRAPHIGMGGPHGCGFYAWGQPEGIQYPINTYASGLPTFVEAVVRLTGRRVLGTRGCLAEHLQILAIVLPVQCTTSDPEAQSAFSMLGPALERMVLARYPEVEVYPSVAAMLTDHPLTPNARKPAA